LIDTLLAAARPLMVEAFTLLGSPVTWVELVAFAIAIAMVFANFCVHPVAWPLAIVSSALYALLFAQSRLYGEAALQLVFIVVAFWGWWQWLRGTGVDGRPLAVHRLTPLLALALDHGTDSDVPWLDALPTVGSLTGQFLLGRKLIENWAVWLLVNVVSVGLFAVKGLWLTVLLYAVFAVLSVVGWRAWARRERAA
jgi:nicotinamide mononucleotide transporter